MRRQTKMINETLTSALIKGAVVISETIKTLAPQVWSIYLKQQLVVGIELLTGGFLTTLAGGFLLHKAYKYHTSTDYNAYDGEGLIVLGYMCLPLAIITGVVLMGSSIGHFINPDYYVIKELLMAIKF